MRTYTITRSAYSLSASMPGCMPDSQDVYPDLSSARQAMPALIESWADAWAFVYEDDKEVANPYWEVSQGDDWADLQIGKYSTILIRINECDVDEDDEVFED